jgi:N-acetylglucosaminyldiphosphoundecaprenol N-acetyl-beta-D-mannosaminyltransferase
VFCDGFGVKLAAGILGMGAIERFTPPDWFPRLAELCVREGFRLYLLGAQPGTAHQAAASLSQRHPGLNIVGTGHGYFDKRVGSPENQAVLENIRAAKPHILIVGFGMPAQERWISENWDDLTANVILPVGAAIDYLAGSIPRAPAWMTGHGLEWLGRLVIEPRRLWKRYLVGNPLFFWRVFKQRLGLVHFE